LNIKIRVKNLIQKHGTRNPFEIAASLGITVRFKPYRKLKGYYAKIKGNKYIVINSNLSYAEQLIVMAHEIAHVKLHSAKRFVFLREYTLFPRGKQEVEANKYAAELLIDETLIDKHMLESLSLSQIAAFLNVPEQYVKYKFNLI
jgi:Zn-dependent peptidase ImmA (M78 family)